MGGELGLAGEAAEGSNVSYWAGSSLREAQTWIDPRLAKPSIVRVWRPPERGVEWIEARGRGDYEDGVWGNRWRFGVIEGE